MSKSHREKKGKFCLLSTFHGNLIFFFLFGFGLFITKTTNSHSKTWDSENWNRCPAKLNMSRLVTNPRKWLWAQRRLRSAWASAQSDQSSQCTQWVAEDLMFLHADSEDSDQTGRMPRLIRVFARRKCHFVGFVMRCLKLDFTTGTNKPRVFDTWNYLSVPLVNEPRNE